MVTVFAGVPAGDLPLTGFDVNSGFVSARQAVMSRRAEDQRACTVVGAFPVWLDHFDRQYAQPQDPAVVTADLAEVINQHPDHRVLLPMGLIHEDHVMVRGCALRACVNLGRPYVVYEELPARVLWPESVDIAGMVPCELPAGSLAVKAAAVGCYESQRWCIDRHACLVPERFWSVADETEA